MKVGLLKSVRIAQNKPDVVRLVLDVNGAKDYSRILLGESVPAGDRPSARSAGQSKADGADAPAPVQPAVEPMSKLRLIRWRPRKLPRRFPVSAECERRLPPLASNRHPSAKTMIESLGQSGKSAPRKDAGKSG